METTLQPSIAVPMKANWRQVSWFLLLAFGLSWALDLVLYLNGGLKSPATGLLLQLQMLLPAFSAILLGLFFFEGSPIYFRTNQTASRWFNYFYLLLTLAYVVGSIFGLMQPTQAPLISSYLLIPNVLGLILLIVLRWKGGKDAFAGAGMAGGQARIWILYGVALVLFYGFQTFLNYIFKLGTPVDLKASLPQLAATNLPNAVLTLLMALQIVVIGPLLGLIIAFGEEYGWRGFLQTELTKMGRIRGIFILGVIWGIWHWPIIWMGYNYPGQPLLGSLVMVGFCIILAYFFGYSVFKSKGVWTAAYLHALNNQVLNFYAITMLVPVNNIFAFGMGIPGLVVGAIAVLFILRDPVWKEEA
jgi:membrane protease YdiL (CAAX protease family)